MATSSPTLGALSSYIAPSLKFSPFVCFCPHANSYSAPARALSAPGHSGALWGYITMHNIIPLFKARTQKGNLFSLEWKGLVFKSQPKSFLLGHPTYRTLVTTYDKLAADATRASPQPHTTTYG
jgi:hypothetical protein